MQGVKKFRRISCCRCKGNVRICSKNPKRTVFLADAAKMSGKELFEKYYPVTNKVKVKTAIRKVLLVTGIYGTMKKCLNRVRGR